MDYVTMRVFIYIKYVD